MAAQRVLGVIVLAQAIVAIDSTVMNVALPTMQATFGFADEARHWVITAYALAFGALLLPAARIAARVGADRALVAGAAVFALASLVGGLAGSFPVLVMSRVLQGIAAAAVAPAALTILGAAFPPSRARARAFGIYGAVGVVGTAAGLILGGPLTQLLTWRSPLFLLAALAGLLATLAVGIVPRASRDATRPASSLGVVLSVMSFSGLVLGFAAWEDAGAAIGVALLGTSALLLFAFITLDRRQQDPLLPSALLESRARSGALTVLGLSAAGLFSVFLFVVYFLQGPLELDPIRASLAILPFPVIAAATAVTLSPRLVRKLGPSGSLIVAACLAATGMGWIAGNAVHPTSVAILLPGIAAMAVGMGIIFAVAPDHATADLSEGDQDAGAASVHVVQQIGGAAGLSVLSLLASGSPDAAAGSYPLVFAATAGFFVLAAALGALRFHHRLHSSRRRHPNKGLTLP